MAPTTLTVRSQIQLPPSISRALLCLIRRRKRSKSSLKGVKDLPIATHTPKSRSEASSSRVSTEIISPAPTTLEANSPSVSLHVHLGIETPRLSQSSLGYDQQLQVDAHHDYNQEQHKNQDESQVAHDQYSAPHEDDQFHTQAVHPLTNHMETDFYSDEDYPMHDLSEQLSLVEPAVHVDQAVQPCDHLVVLHEVFQAIHSLNEALSNALDRYDVRCSV
ncbi:hypothetical protein EST38_g14016 [Candolleomyces aberdarensis]|uniref:Uncharacterized protein n=1 Tax=Candolleomyces aberdarensis TaxID=2316362 RepID=A0A4Q2CZC2_9AGAR|nr:hypothetical protein EST38_g14016 [Candolleomyces aberdarensis]